MIGFVHATAAGRAAAEELAAAWPDSTLYPGRPAEQLAAAWSECDAIVCFLATGATVRLIAPLLTDKATDPAVVCVDEAHTFAVALVGGHRAPMGSNELADRVSYVLGAEPVVTTATDSTGIAALDFLGANLGFRIEDRTPLAAVGRAILDGEPVDLVADAVWPLAALPPHVRPGPAGYTLAITDRVISAGPGTLIYRPPSLVVGVGASRNAPAEEIDALIAAALDGLSPLSVRCVSTIDVKAAEPGILAVAARRGWPVVTYSAAELATVDVPNPSDVVLAEVGTPSVAEAAALYGGPAELVVAKRKSAMATVAVARHSPRGRLAVIGIGPGASDLMSPRARTQLTQASVVVGLDQYVDQVRHLLQRGTRVLVSGLGAEEERARTAVEEASKGYAVALIGSGDAGVYAMASPALELAGDDIDVVGVPGITAAVAASNLLGAPLGHDHAYISLSDLHTPWPAIERRVRAAAGGDFVVCFYNPRSRGRDWQLTTALDILGAARPGQTPVGLVRNASRDGERVEITTIDALRTGKAAQVDMMTVVIVGCSQTQVIAGRMVTPRGYRWMADS